LSADGNDIVLIASAVLALLSIAVSLASACNTVLGFTRLFILQISLIGVFDFDFRLDFGGLLNDASFLGRGSGGVVIVVFDTRGTILALGGRLGGRSLLGFGRGRGGGSLSEILEKRPFGNRDRLTAELAVTSCSASLRNL
jgi:hypothetical protein